MIGRTISHYRILEKLGEGGMGVVYKAEDTKLKRTVALKFLPPHISESGEERERFIHEAQSASALNHPNITTIHEIDEFEGQMFIVMEYVDGRSLKQVIEKEALSIKKVLDIGIQICEGLAMAHEKGIVHRDIKSDNIMLTPRGQAKIMDFGLAKLKGATKLTKTRSTLGTLAYMSPEQAQGEEVDQRSDIFSFGVVLYELLTGKLPFAGEHQAAVIYSIINEEPQPVARFNNQVSVKLEDMVFKALAKDRDERYQHADELLADLRRERKSLDYVKTATLAQPAERQKPLKKKMLPLVLAGLAVVILIVGYFALFHKRQPEPGRKMLAVLPFQNLSPDPDQDYFSDGLTDELITNLSNVKSLCVISRSSVMTFKGSNKKIPEIAKELNVQYIVGGSVRKAGKELRITAQLIDAANDAHLWANKYTGTLEDVFDMQDSVTRAIVEAIRVQLTPDETRRLGKRSFDNPLAYEYYLRGKDEIRKGTEDAIKQGFQYLQKGIDIVGDNALICSGMAWGYWNMVNAGFAQDVYISKAEEYAQKALNLDPELPEAHAMLGWINSAFLGNQSKAVEHFKKALAIDADNGSALGGLSAVYGLYLGKETATLSLVERYYLVHPLDTLERYTWQGNSHFFVGDFPSALGPYRRAAQMGQRDPVYGFFYAMTLAYCDSINEAFSVIDECVKANPTSSVVRLLRLIRLALQRDKEAALRELTPDVQRTCRRDAAWSYHLGALLVLAGARDEGFDWLENAVNRGFINYPFMEKDPFLASIRSEERFKKLMERVKYEWEHFEE